MGSKHSKAALSSGPPPSSSPVMSQQQPTPPEVEEEEKKNDDSQEIVAPINKEEEEDDVDIGPLLILNSRKRDDKIDIGQLGDLSALPLELVWHIVRFVSGKELGVLQQVCTSLYNLAEDESLWQAIAQQRFADSVALNQKSDERSWKWLCKAKAHPLPKGVKAGIGYNVKIGGDEAHNYRFEGEWKDDWPHGYGTMIFEDGTRFGGFWIKEKLEGKGYKRWTDGDLFLGTFKDDDKDGFGQYFFGNGTIFEGYYERDMRHGEGVFVYLDGRKSEGFYAENTRISGRMYWPDGREFYYDDDNTPSEVPDDLRRMYANRAVWFDLVTLQLAEQDKIRAWADGGDEATIDKLGKTHGANEYLTANKATIGHILDKLNTYRATSAHYPPAT